MTVLSPGHVVGPYRIVGPLGRGGMAEVYRAVRAGESRQGEPDEIALKVFSVQRDNVELTRRFRREMQIHAGMVHPHLVRVLESGHEGEIVYVALELVDGGTLEDLLRQRGRLTVVSAVGAMLAVVRALEYLHGRQILHRDVKPSNVLLTKSGRTLLADLGLALDETQTRITLAGQIVGTLPFLPPEMARDEPAGPAVDLYAVGVSLYRLLVAEYPYRFASVVEWAREIGRQAVPKLADAGVTGSPALDAVLNQLLARDPGDRPSAQAARVQLEHILVAAGGPDPRREGAVTLALSAFVGGVSSVPPCVAPATRGPTVSPEAALRIDRTIAMPPMPREGPAPEPPKPDQVVGPVERIFKKAAPRDGAMTHVMKLQAAPAAAAAAPGARAAAGVEVAERPSGSPPPHRTTKRGWTIALGAALLMALGMPMYLVHARTQERAALESIGRDLGSNDEVAVLGALDRLTPALRSSIQPATFLLGALSHPASRIATRAVEVLMDGRYVPEYGQLQVILSGRWAAQSAPRPRSQGPSMDTGLDLSTLLDRAATRIAPTELLTLLESAQVPLCLPVLKVALRLFEALKRDPSRFLLHHMDTAYKTDWILDRLLQERLLNLRTYSRPVIDALMQSAASRPPGLQEKAVAALLGLCYAKDVADHLAQAHVFKSLSEESTLNVLSRFAAGLRSQNTNEESRIAALVCTEMQGAKIPTALTWRDRDRLRLVSPPQFANLWSFYGTSAPSDFSNVTPGRARTRPRPIDPTSEAVLIARVKKALQATDIEALPDLWATFASHSADNMLRFELSLCLTRQAASADIALHDPSAGSSHGPCNELAALRLAMIDSLRSLSAMDEEDTDSLFAAFAKSTRLAPGLLSPSASACEESGKVEKYLKLARSRRTLPGEMPLTLLLEGIAATHSESPDNILHWLVKTDGGETLRDPELMLAATLHNAVVVDMVLEWVDAKPFPRSRLLIKVASDLERVGDRVNLARLALDSPDFKSSEAEVSRLLSLPRAERRDTLALVLALFLRDRIVTGLIQVPMDGPHAKVLTEVISRVEWLAREGRESTRRPLEFLLVPEALKTSLVLMIDTRMTRIPFRLSDSLTAVGAPGTTFNPNTAKAFEKALREALYPTSDSPVIEDAAK